MMKVFAVLTACSLLIPLPGTSLKPKVPTALGDPLEIFFDRSLRSGKSLFSNGNYLMAEKQFRQILGVARSVGNNRNAARADLALGAVYLTLFRFRNSLECLLQGERYALLAHDAEAQIALKANIASLYGTIGSIDNAAKWAREALSETAEDSLQSTLPKIQVELAILRAQQKSGMPEALHLFSAGIREACGAKDWNTCAKAWSGLGDSYLRRLDLFGERNFVDAEPALQQALKIRIERRVAPEAAYRSLGRLRLEQNRFSEARDYLDQAVLLSLRPNSTLPSWAPYEFRGDVRMKQGDLRGALADLRIARQLARDSLRGEAPPDDEARMAAESRSQLGQIYASLVDAAGSLYLQTRDPRFLAEAFDAAEENRAASSLVPAPANLPDEYWSLLNRLQRAEVDSLRRPTPAAAAAVRETRAQLSAIEASVARAEPVPHESLLPALEAKLDSRTAVFTFSEGDRCTWMWAVDRNRASLYRLAPAEDIRRLDQRMRTAIGENSPDLRARAADLFTALFADVSPEFRRKTRWLLALDESLFTIPFAALTEGAGPSAPFLVQNHGIEIVPGVAHWLTAHNQPAPALNPLLVAVGDPIYNLADPRMQNASGVSSPFQLAASESRGLPRLVASGAEAGVCARNWGRSAVLLEGRNANRGALLGQLAQKPAAVHLATHVVESSSLPSQGLIALSLGKNGSPDLLGPREIESWRFDLGLITLSGCASASPSAARSGSGLLGLTRAWLIAGARQVIATRWNIPDESGALFASLYRNLAAPGADPAQALRYAQMEMLRSEGWQSQPRYWGAYFAIGKE